MLLLNTHHKFNCTRKEKQKIGFSVVGPWFQMNKSGLYFQCNAVEFVGGKMFENGVTFTKSVLF